MPLAGDLERQQEPAPEPHARGQHVRRLRRHQRSAGSVAWGCPTIENEASATIDAPAHITRSIVRVDTEPNTSTVAAGRMTRTPLPSPGRPGQRQAEQHQGHEAQAGGVAEPAGEDQREGVELDDRAEPATRDHHRPQRHRAEAGHEAHRGRRQEHALGRASPGHRGSADEQAEGRAAHQQQHGDVLDPRRHRHDQVGRQRAAESGVERTRPPRVAVVGPAHHHQHRRGLATEAPSPVPTPSPIAQRRRDDRRPTAAATPAPGSGRPPPAKKPGDVAVDRRIGPRPGGRRRADRTPGPGRRAAIAPGARRRRPRCPHGTTAQTTGPARLTSAPGRRHTTGAGQRLPPAVPAGCRQRDQRDRDRRRRQQLEAPVGAVDRPQAVVLLGLHQAHPPGGARRRRCGDGEAQAAGHHVRVGRHDPVDDLVAPGRPGGAGQEAHRQRLPALLGTHVAVVDAPAGRVVDE